MKLWKGRCFVAQLESDKKASSVGYGVQAVLVPGPQRCHRRLMTREGEGVGPQAQELTDPACPHVGGPSRGRGSAYQRSPARCPLPSAALSCTTASIIFRGDVSWRIQSMQGGGDRRPLWDPRNRPISMLCTLLPSLFVGAQ